MSVNITDAIFSRAERQPDAIALIDPGRIVDYRTLRLAVCIAAQRFRQAGWQPGDTVGISMREDPALYLVSALALARMGVVQTPVPASDPAPLRLARMGRSGVCALVSDENSSVQGRSLPVVAPDPDWLNGSSFRAAVSDIREPGGGRLWFINETSGTTAAPKRVGVTHDAEDIHRTRGAAIFRYLPGERFLNLTGMRFQTGLRRAICCLSDGGTLTLPGGDWAADGLLRWIDQHNVTHMHGVPLHLHQLLRAAGTGPPRLPAMRMLRTSGAALLVSVVQEVRARLSPNLYISYGISEGGPLAVATPAMLDAHPDTIGRPLAGVELEIVDDAYRRVPDGTPGHVRLRGSGIVTSYLDTTPDQARAFRDGWFYPGDIAVRDGGGLLFLKGRSDEVMNFDGMLVTPGEIESVLLQHPTVTDVAAFALPSPEHQDVPAAAIVSPQPVNSDEMERYCAERLGIRAPRLFVQIDAIPRNAMGKILRGRLTEVVLQKLQEQGLSI